MRRATRTHCVCECVNLTRMVGVQWIFFSGHGTSQAAVHVSYEVPNDARDDYEHVRGCALLFAPGTFQGALSRMAALLGSDTRKWGEGTAQRLLLALPTTSIVRRHLHSVIACVYVGACTDHDLTR